MGRTSLSFFQCLGSLKYLSLALTLLQKLDTNLSTGIGRIKLKQFAKLLYE